MGLGPYVYVGWFVVLLAALVVAVLHLVRGRPQRASSALAAVMGGLLSWLLVSAYIGACEMKDYAGTRAFSVSLVIGMAGLLLLAWSCTRLKNNP